MNNSKSTQSTRAGDGSLDTGLVSLQTSIHALMTNLKQIQGPLSDTRKALPKATSKLDKITQQTEQATQKVMDLVDTISSHQADIITLLNEVMNCAGENDGDSASFTEKLEKAEELANRSQNEAFTIMDALQFQDITTQQINHAASMLEEVETQIRHILGNDGSEEEPTTHADRVFDPHADMSSKQTEQNEIDDLVAGSRKARR